MRKILIISQIEVNCVTISAAKKGKMDISEIFYSIQGEGTNLGVPSVFIRLSGCNLKCIWCDTKFAQTKGKNTSIEQIIKTIKKFPAKHIVITGGEPLLQQKELENLLKLLKNYHIEVETNGTIEPKITQYVNQYNCSPKLEQKLPLKNFPKEKTYYKFVIDKEKDIKKLKNFIKTNKIPKAKLILMPQGKTKKELSEKYLWLAEICKKENFRFTPRLQINIWGNKRKT